MYYVLAGTKAYEGVYDILTEKALAADIRKLSTKHQTSSVEAYHSMVINFAPKLLVFSYEGMVCRYMLHIASQSQFVMHLRLYFPYTSD